MTSYPILKTFRNSQIRPHDYARIIEQHHYMLTHIWLEFQKELQNMERVKIKVEFTFTYK